MVFIEGIIPGRIEIPAPAWERAPRFMQPKRGDIHPRSQPQNHSSRDRGVQLQVNPTARSRGGNRR